ncbi:MULTISPECIES: hypothetical protein [unclassified Lentimicrobium]|uniref:hypothetical protein n=1 Tax=unclassified Lentimicrobium TaxID=2677434 RepID=UPI0015532F3B|nr:MULTISPECIES: hypothetical protein [unclassified Lentimicrobium]NPD47894.1 hypothetical protein [Lentimicrobium sp. S6]NPD86529.1 hypothetical protein [Lentimicrobium sp. L6]
MRSQNLFILIVILIFGLNIYGQESEQVVRNAEQSINKKIEEVHQLAYARDIKKAYKKLDEVNLEIKNEITHETFSKKYRDAKLHNPNYDFQLREDLPSQFNISRWQDYQARCDRIMAGQGQVEEGMKSAVQLNKLDQALAYAEQLKTIYETFKNGAENLGSANLLKFGYDLNGNMNDFIENYKKIEQAKLEGIEIETFQVDFNRMLSKARINKELYKSYQSEIAVCQDAITTFQSRIRYINDLKQAASSGPLKPMSLADRDYTWDYSYFQKAIIQACDEMEVFEIKCAKLRGNIDEIKLEAKEDWTQIEQNISESDDEANRALILRELEDRKREFVQIAEAKYKEAFQIYCIDQSAGEETTTNPFDGASATGSSSVNTESEGVIEEEDEVHDDVGEGDHVIPTENTSTEEYSNHEQSGSMSAETIIPRNAKLIGIIENDGNGNGVYKAIEVGKLNSEDKIIFKKVSGEMKKVQIIYRREGGIWDTKYEGKRTEFTVTEIMEGISPNVTHINFVVNAQHNFWRNGSVPCKMEVYHIQIGGAANQSSSNSSTAQENTNNSSNSTGSSASSSSSSSGSQNNQSGVSVIPTESSNQKPANADLNRQFKEMLSKASEAFNKKYWEDDNGQNSSRNNTQNTLAFLRTADRLSKQEPNAMAQLSMVEQLASACSRYAKRVYAYTDKAQFTELGARAVNQAGSRTSSKEAYAKVANAWRSVRDGATIGDHQYNKGYCDKQYLKFKELAER